LRKRFNAAETIVGKTDSTALIDPGKLNARQKENHNLHKISGFLDQIPAEISIGKYRGIKRKRAAG
jgi:hypothetical protein